MVTAANQQSAYRRTYHGYSGYLSLRALPAAKFEKTAGRPECHDRRCHCDRPTRRRRGQPTASTNDNSQLHAFRGEFTWHERGSRVEALAALYPEGSEAAGWDSRRVSPLRPCMMSVNPCWMCKNFEERGQRLCSAQRIGLVEAWNRNVVLR